MRISGDFNETYVKDTWINTYLDVAFDRYWSNMDM